MELQTVLSTWIYIFFFLTSPPDAKIRRNVDVNFDSRFGLHSDHESLQLVGPPFQHGALMASPTAMT